MHESNPRYQEYIQNKYKPQFLQMSKSKNKITEIKKSTNTLKDGSDPNQSAAPAFKKRIRVQFDLEYNGTTGKIMDENSKTVPDFNLSVRQLIENHTRGHDNKAIVKQPLYFEMEVPTMYDITDVALYREKLEQQVLDVKQFLKEEQNAKDLKAAETLAAANAKTPPSKSTSDTKPSNPS